MEDSPEAEQALRRLFEQQMAQLAAAGGIDRQSKHASRVMDLMSGAVAAMREMGHISVPDSFRLHNEFLQPFVDAGVVQRVTASMSASVNATAMRSDAQTSARRLTAAPDHVIRPLEERFVGVVAERSMAVSGDDRLVALWVALWDDHFEVELIHSPSTDTADRPTRGGDSGSYRQWRVTDDTGTVYSINGWSAGGGPQGYRINFRVTPEVVASATTLNILPSDWRSGPLKIPLSPVGR